jgi:hypothetical protein
MHPRAQTRTGATAAHSWPLSQDCSAARPRTPSGSGHSASAEKASARPPRSTMSMR